MKTGWVTLAPTPRAPGPRRRSLRRQPQSRGQVELSWRIFSSTSPSSGKRPTAFLEKISSPLTVTSKTPPVEGRSSKLATLFFSSPRTLSANLAALGRYPQAVQYSTWIRSLSDIAVTPLIDEDTPLRPGHSGR